jgi:hypothetical protein
MKFKLLSLSLFSLSAVSPLMIPSLTHPAVAGCVAVDVSTQVAVDGNRKGNQSNSVNQGFGPNCRNGNGGNVTSVGNQVCHSTSCAQSRHSSQYADGDPNNPTGVSTPNIPIQVHVPVHVYDPSKDPNFPFNKK